MIVGPRATVEAYWDLVRAWHAPPRLVRERQFVMTLDRARLRPYDRSVTVRHARPDEWTAVADNSARDDRRRTRLRSAQPLGRVFLERAPHDRRESVVGRRIARTAVLLLQHRTVVPEDRAAARHLDAARVSRPRTGDRPRSPRSAIVSSTTFPQLRSTSTISTRRRSRSIGESGSRRRREFQTLLF